MNTEVASLSASALFALVIPKIIVAKEIAEGYGRHDMHLELCTVDTI